MLAQDDSTICNCSGRGTPSKRNVTCIKNENRRVDGFIECRDGVNIDGGGQEPATLRRKPSRWSLFGSSLHDFLDLPCLPIRTQPAPRTKYRNRMGCNANTPTDKRPLHPPPAAGYGIDDNQKCHHQNEDQEMQIESFDRFDDTFCPKVF